MTARQEAGDGELHRLGFADDDFTNLLRECIDPIFHAEIVRAKQRRRNCFADA